MIRSEGLVGDRRPRRRHAFVEKRRIVELTFEPGASVEQVAQANGVNANQVPSGGPRLSEVLKSVSGSTAMLPVTISAPCTTAVEYPPRRNIRRRLVLFILSFQAGQCRERCRCCAVAIDPGESAKVIQLPAETRIWSAAGNHRPAPRLRLAQCPSTDRVATAAVLRSRIYFSRQAGRHHQVLVVRWRWPLSLRQAFGERSIYLTGSFRRHHFSKPRTAVDAYGRHRSPIH